MTTISDVNNNLNNIITTLPTMMLSVFATLIIMFLLLVFFTHLSEYFEAKNIIKNVNKLLIVDESFESVVENISLIEMQITANNRFLKNSDISNEQILFLNEQLKLKFLSLSNVIEKIEVDIDKSSF